MTKALLFRVFTFPFSYTFLQLRRARLGARLLYALSLPSRIRTSVSSIIIRDARAIGHFLTVSPMSLNFRIFRPNENAFLSNSERNDDGSADSLLFIVVPLSNLHVQAFLRLGENQTLDSRTLISTHQVVN